MTPGNHAGRRRSLAALVVAVGLSVSAGCASGFDDDDTQQLTVFAAASLTGAFSEIADGFEQDHPGVDVRFSFDGSSGLVDQIIGGAPADVFASADIRTMDRAVSEGVVTGEPSVFATNILTLITPPDNPAGITGLDSSLEGSRLVVCAENVPCGNATRSLAASAGVELRPVSEASTVTDVRGKVTSGEADAGIVYATDARAVADEVEQVPVAGAEGTPNRYPVAVLDRAGDSALARQFVDAVTGPRGRAVLTEFGFGPA